MSRPILMARDIGFWRGRAQVLDGVDLDISEGEIVALLGINGAGKSSLLRIMLGLLPPQRGELWLDQRPMRRLPQRQIARRLAYLPQAHVATFPYTVEQIIALGRVPHAGLGRRLDHADQAAVMAAMERLQLEPLAGRPYTELSGGERQRVLLARALAQQAAVLVMDEPLAGLDFGHQMRFLALLTDLAADGYAVLLSTHRPEEAWQCASRAVLLAQGRVIANGAPGEVINGAAMSALYGVDLQQIDASGQRFFSYIPDSPRTSSMREVE